jgi:ferrous iron transport protein A
MTLDQLKPNQKAVIIKIDKDEVPLKLIEMGCMVQHEVQFISKAPLGDPLCFEIDGTRLAIRKETAKHIEIVVN